MRQYRNPNADKTYRRYWQVRLTGSDGKSRHHHVHNIVARAFLGVRPEGQQVRHGPAGMLDNSVPNLSYGTAADQQADRRRDGTDNAGSRNPNAKLTGDDVSRIRQYAADGRSQKELAVEFRCSTATISMIVNRRSWVTQE